LDILPTCGSQPVLEKNYMKYEIILPEVLYITKRMKVEFTGMFRKDSAL
jgi:hypothetical protein